MSTRHADLSTPGLRLLLATDSLEPSGVGEHMVTLAAALRQAADVMLMFADAPGARPWAERALALGLPVCIVPAEALVEGGPTLQGVLDRYRPDVVHVHAGICWEGHGLVAAACRFAGAQAAVVRTEHLPYVLRTLGDPALEAVYAGGVRAVDRILCVCEAACRTYRMSGVDPARFAVVHNGIVARQPARSRQAVRAELGVVERAPLVLTVARFTEQKRHATLLEAVPAVLAVHPLARFAWVGCGPEEPGLRRRAAALGVTDRLLFLGRRSDVPDLLAAADLFCLPSIFEGHPLVVLEAMAAGLPVVATRSLGVTEAVRHEDTGLLVPVDHVPALAFALNRILGQPALAARLGAAGRAAVQAGFSADRMARETLAVYRAACDAPQPCREAFLGYPRSLSEVLQIQRRAQQCFSVTVPFSSRRRGAGASFPVAPFTAG